MNFAGTIIGNANTRLRHLAGCSAITWQSYLRLRGKPLPDPKKIDLIIEGYPRSGNTYAEHMLRIMCPDMRWISHTHSVGTLLWSKKHRIPSIILVRDPQEAAVSLYIYQMQRVALRLCLAEWAAFYRNAGSLEYVSFVSFDSLTSNTEASLALALTELGLANRIQNPLPPDPRASFDASHDHDKWHLREVRGIHFGDEQGNRPSEQRSSLKNNILHHIQDCKDTALFNELKRCSQIANSSLNEKAY